MRKLLLLSIVLLLSIGFGQDYSGQYTEQSGETSLNLLAVNGGYEGQLIQGEINVKIQAQISEGSLRGLLLMKDIGFAKNVYFEATLEGNQLNLTTAPIDDKGNLDQKFINKYVLIRSQTTIAGKIPSGPNPLGAPTPNTTNPLGGNQPATNPLGANQPATNPLGGNPSAPLASNNNLDFSGVFIEKGFTTRVELFKSGNGYEGLLLDTDLRVKIKAEVINGQLIGVFLYKEAGYERDLYLEASLSGNELNIGFAPIDAQGNFDRNALDKFIMIKQNQAASSGQTNTGSSPGKIGGSKPLSTSNGTANPVATNPLGSNQTAPVSANTSDYSGVYIEDGNSTRLELFKVANGYEGILTDQELTVKLQAQDTDGKLVGIFLFKDAGYAQNLYFEGLLSANKITIQFAAIDDSGNVDQSTSETFTMTRQSGATTTTGQTQVASNPLANSGANSQDFVGRFVKDRIELTVQLNANGYQGVMTTQDKQFPFLAQLNGSVLVGNFSADGQEIPFEARLEENSIVLNIGNDSFQLERVNTANKPSSKIPTNPLTNRGNTNNSQPVAQNPITTIPVANSNTGSTVQAGQSYTAGSIVNSPWTGVSFSVPSGYSAAYEPEAGFFVIIADNQQSLLLLQAASQASAWSMASLAVGFLKEIAEGEIQFLNEPQETQNSLKVSVSGDDTVMHVESKSGPSSNAVVVLATGIDAQTLSGFVSTINLSSPQVQKVDFPLGGLALQRDAEDGIVEGGLYNNKNENESYLFCSDGRYGYEYNSSEDISMGSYSDTFTESDEHSGNWHPVASLMGENVLMLEATDGRVLVYSVSQSANGIMVNNKEFKASANGQCN